MEERVERAPTLQEIVVALRQARHKVGRGPAFSVVHGDLAGDRGVAAVPDDAPWQSNDANEAGELRDGEIERLLGENARLNQRVVQLLKIIEREQARSATMAAERAVAEANREAIAGEVRGALEKEFKQILLAVLRLLSKQRAETAAPVGGAVSTEESLPLAARVVGAGPSAHAAVEPTPSEWMVDLMRKLREQGAAPAEEPAGPAPRPTLRWRLARAIHACF